MNRRTRAPSIADQHRSWLELVDADGPFLAVPPLKRVWPQGIPAIDNDRRVAMVAAKPAFDAAWDAWDRDRDDAALERYRLARDAWVQVMVRQVIGWADLLTDADAVPGLLAATTVHSREGVTVAPTAALVHDDLVGALVRVIDPVDSLRDLVGDDWATTPIDRMDLMLRSAGCPTTIGVVTDGRWWGIVSAAPGTMTASGVVDAQTFVEEAATRNAFAAILHRRHLVGGAPADRLPELFRESVLAAEEITEALGVQVRRAVELVVSAFGEAAQDAQERRRHTPGARILPDDQDLIYDAAVTVMMRVVFLLFAQERGLLPEGPTFEDGYGLAGVLDDLDDLARAEGEEAMGATYQVWHRLLATSRALYSGATFEDVRMTAYGGSLFDPDRFAFLTATNDRDALRLAVSDRVMLHVLRAVQQAKGNRISFRDIDVEQIGYIYEGLLGYTCAWAPEVTVGLVGADGQEPEIELDLLDDMAEQHPTDATLATAILAWAKQDQPGSKLPSTAALARNLREGDAAPDAERALLAVTTDPDLRARLRPYIGVIRRDLRNRPTVILPGGLLVVETPSRRNSGAHYTPRSLAEQVVEHALQPLVYAPGPHQLADPDQWVPVSSDRILDLRIADIACGSGAFLVAAARYLARKLVEAWHREGTATGSPQQQQTHALRLVVARCLYGADINAMAVEMCKLSLWLVSLDAGLPFSFVDDKVLHGNALLGLTSLQQLEALHIDPGAVPQQGLFEADRGIVADRLQLDTVIEQVRRRRRQIASEVNDSDPQRSRKNKRRLLDLNEQDLARLSRVADGVIAAGLRLGGKPGKKLNESYQNLRVAVGLAFPADGAGHADAGERAMLDAIIDQGLTPTVPTDYERWKPLHWALAVPDVVERGGFDAIIGNPPFLGGQKLTGAMGTNVRDWFVTVLAGGTRGSADLVAYFFLRAFGLLTTAGNLGLIATNTVAQGDTREVGLDRLETDGFTITRAIQSRAWPAASANLEFAGIWGTRSEVAADVPRWADGIACRRISTLLEPAGRTAGKPVRLAENSGIAFQGCIVLGMGFVLEPDEARQWIRDDAANAEVLFPYLNGEDLNSRPDCSASRWVIDFYDRSESGAACFPVPFSRVLSKVKSERQKVNRKALRERWWQYAEKRPGMRRAIAGLDEVLVIARVSKTVMPLRVRTGFVPSDQVVVFATDSFSDQAVLSSSLHRLWAVTYSSTLETRVRYTPSDVLETFPRPQPTDALYTVGKVLDSERREILLRRELGLTKLYNLINDPALADSVDKDVARMREIHVELDETVMAAYGWDDVPLDHGFHTYRQMTRWTVSPEARVEILDRLLEENHRRAARQGDVAMAADDSDAETADAEEAGGTS